MNEWNFEQYLRDCRNVINRATGRVMKATDGRADAMQVRRIILKQLDLEWVAPFL